MRKSRVHKYRFVLIALLNMLCLYAAAQQHFRYKATLDTVQQDGFYKISLTPAIVAECQPQLSDIRIKRNDSREMPFIVKAQTSSATTANIILFPLIKGSNPNKIVFQNGNVIGTNELILFIKNTDATRTATLSGSDDTSHWFVIKENIALAKEDNEKDRTFFNQTIQFPYSNYRYFQISMPGKDMLPLNIFQAGVYRTSSIINDILDVIPQPFVIQQDSSNKRSYIQLRFDKNYQIDKLCFSLSGAKFFNRSFTLYNGISTGSTVLASGNVTSGDSSTTLNVGVKTNALLLVINNFDNAPLTLNKITAYQLPVALLTYLNGGNNYSLFFGDSTLQAPAYDLQYFSDSIHTNTYPLAIKGIEQITVPAGTKASANNHLPAVALWSIIIAVLLLLIYFSYTLLKDINKTTNTDAHL